MSIEATLRRQRGHLPAAHGSAAQLTEATITRAGAIPSATSGLTGTIVSDRTLPNLGSTCDGRRWIKSALIRCDKAICPGVEGLFARSTTANTIAGRSARLPDMGIVNRRDGLPRPDREVP
jgi:hypothetical protein